MNTIFDKFIGFNSLSKTLRFELIPVGKTFESIKNQKLPTESCDIFASDQNRNNYYEEMKKILDSAHKELLESALKHFDQNSAERGQTCNWQKLQHAYIDYQKSDKNFEQKKILDKTTAYYRNIIVDALKSDKLYSLLTDSTPKNYISKALEKDENNPALLAFNGFATYFKGFQENRKNIYSNEAQTTSAANRAINENFPKFMTCCRIYNLLKQKYPEIIAQISDELEDYLQEQSLDEVFNIESYGKFLAQSGIDWFNALLD